MLEKEELHKKTKNLVYQIIMTFKDFEQKENENLINQIKKSATKLSAHCRNLCEISDIKKEINALQDCSAFIDEIIHLLSLLKNTRTFDRIKTEEIILQAFEIKQETEHLCSI